jgi:hypothetical protein
MLEMISGSAPTHQTTACWVAVTRDDGSLEPVGRGQGVPPGAAGLAAW